MAARKKIVFPYYNNYYTSTAIIIYQTNIIKTLNLLQDNKKPHLYIWHNHHSPLNEIKAINYPYINFINIKSFNFRIYKLMSAICDKLGLSKFILFNTDYDSIYPAYHDNFLNGIKRRIYWKADFQENYYPQYFVQEEINWVKDFFNHLKKDASSPLVLSSNDAFHDYNKFYPNVKNPVLLFRFISHVAENLDFSKLNDIKQKFNITKPYFIVCNQYWPHKNHIVVLKALHQLKQNGILNFQFVFTGKTSSIRGNNYFKELQQYILENNLHNDIVITDFVDRENQLILMKKAIAIVQPTTFEGWSTVIEDGKALNQYVVASNIAVNIEQIEDNVSFFNPQDSNQLAEIIQQISSNYPKIVATKYNKNIEASIQDLIAIFEL
jgi:glycosyltransferase involved in cell wall biosynthesis